MTVDYGKPLSVTATSIPGVLLFDLPVHGDNRGWFKENWQRAKMTALGLPDFGPVQNNISFNDAVGTTRGIHAEPWDKFISVATGRVFGAWVDLRAGESFGQVFTAELDPSKAIFIPRGVGNAFQTLEPNTAYTYVVNDHWSADAQSKYTFLNLADDTVAIDWPIPLDQAELSDKDKKHPFLADVSPMLPPRIAVLGASGQLGTALATALPQSSLGPVDYLDQSDLNLTDPASIDAFDWSRYGTIINAAAYTNVDGAETPEGRELCWAINATAVAHLAKAASEHHLTLVHVSSDYVFDGTRDLHTEDEPLAPLGVYGQAKAAGDLAVVTVPQHYLLRTSWVIGEGKNFVRTMVSLAERGIDPAVVDDQVGRLTFTADIAAAIIHLLTTGAAPGTYNITNDGPTQSWAEIAADVFELSGHERNRVSGISTAEYFAGKQVAPRPLKSALNLAKIVATGFSPRPASVALAEYLAADTEVAR